MSESAASRGTLNRIVGWTTLLIGLSLSAALDPWLFDVTSTAEFDASLRPAARHAHGVVIGMGLLQLAMAHLLATGAFPPKARVTAAALTTTGALLYAAGYALGLRLPTVHVLVLMGSLINFCGFAFLWRVGARGTYARMIHLILPVACFGMLLDFTAGWLYVLPDAVVVDSLGAGDGVRLRMLRLARVAAIALSVLTLLYFGVAPGDGPRRRTARWGGISLACGAVGMPAILAVSCFVSVAAKYLLPLPATAVTIGVLLGLYYSVTEKRPLEGFGWGLIVISILAGLLMGLYAFDGPFSTPQFLGEYNDTPRRLSRLAHSYCIVLGIVAIFLSRETASRKSRPGLDAFGSALFVAGCTITVSVLVVMIVMPLSSAALSAGPALTLIGAGIRLTGMTNDQ